MPYLQNVTLYIMANDEAGLQAERMLSSAGFRPDIRRISPFHPRAIYGTPILFGLGNRFEGLEGIRVFIDNAALLGHAGVIAPPYIES